MGASRVSYQAPPTIAGAVWTPKEIEDVEWVQTDRALMFTDTGSTAVTTDGDLVQTLKFKSNSLKKITQATSGNRPTFRIVSSVDYLEFDGTNDIMALTTGAFQQVGPGGVWTMMFYGSMSNTVHMVFSRYDGSTPQWRLYNQGSSFRVGHFGSPSVTALTVGGTYGSNVLITCGYNGTRLFIAVGRASYTTSGSDQSTPFYTTSTAPVEIASRDSGFDPFTGKVRSLIYTPTYLSITDRDKVADYYGV